MEEKVKIVKGMKDQFGLNQSLAVIGLCKKTWYYQVKGKVNWKEKHQALKADLFQVIRDHPDYGYKRAASELRDTYGWRISPKTVLKLTRDNQLQLLTRVRKPKPSFFARTLLRLGNKMNLVALKKAKEEIIGPLEVTYTDFTEIVYDQGRKKAQLMPIIDHRTKIALGWALGQSANSQVALKAWKMAETKIKKLGFLVEGIIIHHDRDPVYTGHQWLGQLLLVSQVQVSYALRGAKDNPEMESFNSRLKSENRTLFWECQNPAELERVVGERIKYYNTNRRHSSLGNQSPLTYLKKRQKHCRF